MISIKKYLNAPAAGRTARIESAPKAGLAGLCSGLLESIANYVLTGDACSEARAKLGLVGESLHPALSPGESDAIQEYVRGILAERRSAAQDNATRTAADMRHLAEMLGQALTLVAAGGERSSAHIQKIQGALRHMSRMQDFAALKKSLGETIRLIDEDSVRGQQEADRELADFRAEVTSARDLLLSNPDRRLPGRPEGVSNIRQALQSVQPEHALYVVAFAFDRLDAIVQRYGPDAAEDLMYRLVRERVQPLAPANSAFRWTSRSLVGVFQRPRDFAGLRSEAVALNREPLVHRVPLGNRTAVLTVSPSHMVAEGAPDAPEALLDEVDRFTGANA